MDMVIYRKTPLLVPGVDHFPMQIKLYWTYFRLYLKKDLKEDLLEIIKLG